MEKVSESLRFYRKEDVYSYQVDNIPIKELLDKCILLQNQIDLLPDEGSFVQETTVSDECLPIPEYSQRLLSDVSNLSLFDSTGVPLDGESLFFESPTFSGTLPDNVSFSAFTDVTYPPTVEDGTYLQWTGAEWMPKKPSNEFTMVGDFNFLNYNPQVGDFLVGRKSPAQGTYWETVPVTNKWTPDAWDAFMNAYISPNPLTAQASRLLAKKSEVTQGSGPGGNFTRAEFDAIISVPLPEPEFTPGTSFGDSNSNLHGEYIFPDGFMIKWQRVRHYGSNRASSFTIAGTPFYKKYAIVGNMERTSDHGSNHDVSIQVYDWDDNTSTVKFYIQKHGSSTHSSVTGATFLMVGRIDR